MRERHEADTPGRSIIVTSWITFALFAVTMVPDAAGLRAFDKVSSGIALAWFLVSLPLWLYAFVLGVMRNARGEDVGIGNLFFLTGSAPPHVRKRLLGALIASAVVAIATVWANAFAVLEPMLPFALAGLWGARHGEFPDREAARVAAARTNMQGSGR